VLVGKAKLSGSRITLHVSHIREPKSKRTHGAAFASLWFKKKLFALCGSKKGKCIEEITATCFALARRREVLC
jgi:hypothetical protein